MKGQPMSYPSPLILKRAGYVFCPTSILPMKLSISGHSHMVARQKSELLRKQEKGAFLVYSTGVGLTFNLKLYF